MTTVRILPEILSNQIAAGEVVQRPSNAVKELVENSIDAGARSITIEIERGGKSLIRISDDGIGLSRDDALLAIERYATSKIYKKEDLFSISTMGFRGEALPSIASVSKFVLVTRTADSDIGTRIDISGGKLTNVSDAGAPVGTMVEVKHLLFNTPARKKFLKSDNTENSHIADAIWGMALGNPNVQFRLFVNGRLQKSFSQNDNLFQRSVNILGKDLADKLYALDFSDDVVRIHGYCSNPLVTRSTSSRIFLFVNRRLIYDRGLISAIFQGYKGRIMKGRFPLGVFFIEIDFDQVDVNVHPSKREIKFFNGRQVYQTLAKAIREAMSREQDDMTAYAHTDVVSGPFHLPQPRSKDTEDSPIKSVETFAFYDTEFPPEKNVKVEQPPLNFNASAANNNAQGVLRGDLDLQAKNKAPYEDIDPPINDLSNSQATRYQSTSYQATSHQANSHQGSKQEPDTPLEKLSEQALPGGVENLKIVGQVMGTYILAETKNGLVLIDQHAAHERIVYEKLKQRYQSLKGQCQRLALPETLDLNFKEADFLNGILDDLNALGMIIEPFGGNTFVIKAVPSILDEKEIKPLIVDMVESALVKKDRFSKETWLEDCLILMACHGAIRANLRLNDSEMNSLVNDLEQCENTRHCPHGRPIMIFWEKNQIEKLFKRVV